MTLPHALEPLQRIRRAAGPRSTSGLTDAELAPFLHTDASLARAIQEAVAVYHSLRPTWGPALAGPEHLLISALQQHYVNFYDADAINPYVPLAARGPWIITSHGAVIHDSGGYGMLGFGHAPDDVLAALARPDVIANVMTASFSQARFAEALRAEVGHTRAAGCPFAKFICMNSGSEAVTVATRISDIQAARLTAKGARHEGREIKFLGITGGFHGRTDRPAQASSSSARKYEAHLASFRDQRRLVTVPPNDVAALRAAFAKAERDGVFFEMMLVEPVMGEGNPGMAMSRAFYDEARRLTREMGTLLLVDAIQAGLRAQGVLSLVDYPDFTDAEPPDLETWSKALNAAQYPLSVLGLTEAAAALYARGVYGNTMTTNPRALEVGTATLNALTPELRSNIREQGAAFKAALEALQTELPDVILGVQGTGLLLAAELNPEHFPVTGPANIEHALRCRGLGVIHGGRNALRFTPHFRITSAEIALVVRVVGEVLRDYAGRLAAK